MNKILSIIMLVYAVISAQNNDFIKGVDLSSVKQIEDLGGTYYLDGTATDPLEIFSQNGIEWVRLRLWHTPEDVYSGLGNVISYAEKIKAHGLKLLLDFHYSDSWADPGKQNKPAAWLDTDYDTLSDSLYNYTYRVIKILDSLSIAPEMVQAGNEIIQGMLWPDGRVGGDYETDTQWQQFTSLLTRAINAVSDAVPDKEIKIMIHIDRGGDNGSCKWFYGKLINYNVPFDVIGLSYYPWWHGTLDDLRANLNDLSTRYNKELVVAETAYPWTLQWFDNENNIVGTSEQLHQGYPASVEGQKSFLVDLMSVINDVPNQKGLGMFYWEPAYIAVAPYGSPWENLAMFDFQGNALASLEAFNINTGIEYEDDVILSYELLENYPNPFNPSTIIKYNVTQTGNVKLTVLNLLGEEIKILVDDYKQTGHYNVEWFGDNNSGTVQSSGVYIIRLQTPNSLQIKKALLIK